MKELALHIIKFMETEAYMHMIFIPYKHLSHRHTFEKPRRRNREEIVSACQGVDTHLGNFWVFGENWGKWKLLVDFHHSPFLEFSVRKNFSENLR